MHLPEDESRAILVDLFDAVERLSDSRIDDSRGLFGELAATPSQPRIRTRSHPEIRSVRPRYTYQ